jgi:hypothetical protein
LTTLVDSNVLFDYNTEDAEWFEWSAAMLTRSANLRNGGPLLSEAPHVSP